MLVRVVASHFVAGLVFDSADEFAAVCIRAAPILGYARGWSYRKCRAYLQKSRGWQLQIVS
jgi:hypothetical protein